MQNAHKENIKRLHQLRELNKEIVNRLEQKHKEFERKLQICQALTKKKCEIRLIQDSLLQFQLKKALILESLSTKNEEINKYKKICNDRDSIVKERINFIKAFNNKFQDEYDACQKKFQTIDIRDTVIRGVRRLFLFQICTIFFDNDIMKVFNALHMISKHLQDVQFQPTQNQEEYMACSLGYLGLLQQIIARVCGTSLKHQFIFKGARSEILKNEIEYQNIQTIYFFFFKQISLIQRKLKQLVKNQNLYIIMDDLNIPKHWRNQGVGVIVGKIGEVLWVDI